MINTYKESSLHRTLKQLYSLNENSKTEVEADGHIYDILTDSGNVIEIQTQNLGKLKEKLLDAISKGRKVKVVHPVIQTKTIVTYSKDGRIFTKRKSPKKGSFYSAFDELKGIFPLLLNENFSIDLLLINMTEDRIKTDQPEQSENGRRRFKKDWQKSDKHLEEIIETKILQTPADYLSFLPEALPAEFTVNDIKKGLKENSSRPKNAFTYANLIAWTFSHAGLIEQTGKSGNSKIYRIKSDLIKPENYGTFQKQ